MGKGGDGKLTMVIVKDLAKRLPADMKGKPKERIMIGGRDPGHSLAQYTLVIEPHKPCDLPALSHLVLESKLGLMLLTSSDPGQAHRIYRDQ